MKCLALLSLTCFGALLAAPPVLAGGTIDATTYLPVGAFNAWEMIDKVLWADGTGIKDDAQIISVSNTFVVDGVPRYNVRTPFFNNVKDLIFQLGVDNGTLFLYGLRVIDPDADLGVSDLSVPTVFFDEPVPVGDTTTALDSIFQVTPVTSDITVELDLGPKSVSGKVHIEGTVTATWNSVAPINTPLGQLGGAGQPLAELQIDVVFTYSSDDDDINDELEGIVTSKGVSGVMGPGVGFVQIDGKGNQQKIVNRVILPGDLLSSDTDLDAFPPLPAGDLQSFSLAVPDLVSLQGAVDSSADAPVTDGVVTLDALQLDQKLGGTLVLTGEASAGTDGPVDVILLGKAKPDKLTGGIKITLKGHTKKLPSFAKNVNFSVSQVLLPPFDAGNLDIVYNAGKDPITKELITGTLPMPITPFVAASVDVAVNLPVDVPKLKGGLLIVNPAKHSLGAEGLLTLHDAGLTDSRQFPVILKETATVKEGLPTARTYTLVQTGTTLKLFGFAATSTDAQDFALTKLTGKLLGVKLAPVLTDVEVTAQ